MDGENGQPRFEFVTWTEQPDLQGSRHVVGALYARPDYCVTLRQATIMLVRGKHTGAKPPNRTIIYAHQRKTSQPHNRKTILEFSASDTDDRAT